MAEEANRYAWLVGERPIRVHERFDRPEQQLDQMPEQMRAFRRELAEFRAEMNRGFEAVLTAIRQSRE